MSKAIAVYIPMVRSDGTFGMSLQGLKYSAPLLIRLAYIAIDTIVPLVSDKMTRQLRELIQLLRLLNYLTFFASGSFPSLLHMILRLAMVPRNANMVSGLDFDYMHRQLVWQAMTEAATIAVPLWRALNQPGTVFHRVFKRLGSGRRLSHLNLPFAVTTEGCAVCGHEKPATLRVMPGCKHTFCHYCYEISKRDIGCKDGRCPICV